ncbi:C40 family peptidase [Streptomyces sp. UNOC14_S4]|uniref:C40 family peptidase n=1 Tax=Streptomyces sp. UNOC14_S4 TaxID=2872340 RepID=UPI001E501B39|nr:C40 family peptidase [Streptomyces sp. UNOC14_S4]
MATHRKPKQHPLASSTARTAATLALAGAATATASVGTSQAAPRPTARLTTAELRDRVDRYFQRAEVATERYNGAKEKARAAETAIGGLQDEAARKTQRLNATRASLGNVATAQYRDGGLPATMRLLLSSAPEQYLERASLADRAGSRQAVAVNRLRHQLRDVQQVRSTADTRLAELKRQETSLARHKHTIEVQLNDARQLLNRMPAPVRTAVEQGNVTAVPDHAVKAVAHSAVHTVGHAVGHTVTNTAHAVAGSALQAPTERAARAVAYAYSALGKPYVWGATGPSAFDCSGLAQAAWQAAGVSLPRTTYTQINAGRRVARGSLAPGDLVFFYPGVSHVGIYVGNGQMIHAPHPGAPVRVAPVGEMPFAGAIRPA